MPRMKMGPDGRAAERKPALARMLHECVEQMERIAANAELLGDMERDEQELLWLRDVEGRALACADALRVALPTPITQDEANGQMVGI